jgi:hypothetical protein
LIRHLGLSYGSLSGMALKGIYYAGRVIDAGYAAKL